MSIFMKLDGKNKKISSMNYHKTRNTYFIIPIKFKEFGVSTPYYRVQW